MIEIGQKLYTHRLLGLFWHYKPVNKEDKELSCLIERICRGVLVEKGKKTPDLKEEKLGEIVLTTEEQGLIRKYNLLEHPNIEVKARCLDVMIRFGKGKEKLIMRKEASKCYLKVYEDTGNPHFFVRSIELLTLPQFYNEDLLQEIKRVAIAKMADPSWMAQILNRIKKNLEDGVDNPYIKDILAAYAAVMPKQYIFWKDKYWNMLYEIGAINDESYFYNKAIAWEEHADRREANRKENEYCADTPENYKNSYIAIEIVKVRYTSDFERIRDKYNKAKQDYVGILSLFGVPKKYVVPEKMEEEILQHVGSIHLNSIIEAILQYHFIPFYTSSRKIIGHYAKVIMESAGVLEKCIDNNCTLDNEGNTIGISDFKNSHIMEAHKYVRPTQLYYLSMLYFRVREHDFQFSEDIIGGFLMTNKPTFIEDDRVEIWAKAYYYYFVGETYMACHLLMPQLEHALHNLLELKEGDVTMLSNDVQKEPNLTWFLKGLRRYGNQALLDELDFFLNNGSDVNLRNRLMHGLIRMDDMLRYGHYLFYIANLLYLKGEEFLQIGEGVVSKCNVPPVSE